MSSNGMNIARTIKESIHVYLQGLAATALGKSADAIDVTAGFFDLGMDSKMTMQLVSALEDKVGHELYPTLLFEYQSIEDLGTYLLENDKQVFSSMEQDHSQEIKEENEVIASKEDANAMSVKPESIHGYLQELAAIALGKSADSIDVTAGFFDLGMDSKMTMQLVSTLEDKVGHELYPTLLFEYQNIEDLSTYLFENDKEAFAQAGKGKTMAKVLGTTRKAYSKNSAEKEHENIETTTIFDEASNEDDIWGDTPVFTNVAKDRSGIDNGISKENDAIAIVGISGRYPGANTISEFWDNLKTGKDCISAMPKDRWGKNARYPEELLTGKWGGFIDDVDKFDPLHFKIAPAEAEYMDPQVRLFLEESWKTFEDAGFCLSTSKDKNIGVFVGSMFNSYPSAAKNKSTTDKLSFNTGWTIANRVSYHLGLTGPSMHVNTACSSSLTAVIEACQSIKNGMCSSAIAGGVNLSLDALKWEHLQEFGLLGSKTTSRSFAEGDGYLPGEGVGAVLLKPLSKAEQDGDRIYGVIKGGNLNHNGAGNGFTVPNLKAQAALIKESLERSGIDAEDISYVEAAANGSAMGDPIEITALSHLFSNDKKKVAMGSVKSQIGHLESASGISQLTKVLLQLKHKTLVPGIKAQILNPNLGLNRTSLEINEDLKEWEATGTRLAMVNNFGAGGANAHVVVEEYNQTQKKYIGKEPAIVLLSAKNKDRLKEQVDNLHDYLEDNVNTNLYDLAYTLQIGREPMEERFVTMVNTISELKEVLASFQRGETTSCLVGNVQNGKSDFILKGNAGKAYMEVAIRDKEIESLMQLWIKGVTLDWSLIYDNDNRPNKISLPNYPFAKESYWIPELDENTANVEKLHPLLHRNESDFSEQKYESVFTGKERFLRNHITEDKKILPEVVYIELAREAGKRSLHKNITQLKDVSWPNPISVNGKPKQIHISLFEDADEINYEIYSLSNMQENEEIIHGKGKLGTETLNQPSPVDVFSIKSQLPNHKDKETCLSLFKALGLSYGTGVLGIESLYSGKDQALVDITISRENSYSVQLGVLDSAIQACLSLAFNPGKVSLNMPFSIKGVNVYGDVNAVNWCHIRKLNENENKGVYAIDLLSKTGEVVLRLEDFTIQKITSSNNMENTGVSTTVGLHTYQSFWKPERPNVKLEADSTTATVLLAGGNATLAERLKDILELDVFAISENTEIEYYNEIQHIAKSKLKEKEKTHIIVLYANRNHVDYGFVSGLLKTIHMESPKITGKTVGVEDLSIADLDVLVDVIRKEKKDFSIEVRYNGAEREVKKIMPTARGLENNAGIKEGGVYLITGGTGGLGLIFAEHISKTKGTKLILTGRSEKCKLNEETLQAVNAIYHSCDVNSETAVQELIDKVVDAFGTIDGIIHGAGIIRDNFLVQKTKEEATEVLLPKINGAKNLDQATKNLDLDFIMYCASLSGVLGNVGQADYSSANAWMDNYAQYRNELKDQGKRKGHTLSIDWPLWESGGMQIDETTKRYLNDKWGMQPLPTAEGIFAFETFLHNNVTQGVVAYGMANKIEPKLKVERKVILDVPENKVTIDKDVLKVKVVTDVTKRIASILKLEESRLDKDVNFSDYGAESAMVTVFSKALNDHYEGLEILPMAFVNNPTINELVDFLLEDHLEVIARKEQGTIITKNKTKANVVKVATFSSISNKRKKRFVQNREKESDRTNETIAIIGMSGRFSTIDTEDELWSKTTSNIALQLDRETVTSSDFVFGNLNIEDNVSGWPILNISSKEASQMSIQEQLIFEELSKTMKHYGIDRRELSSKSTGVFIAAQEIYGSKNEIKEGQHTLAYLIPNKISYYLNLKGPSEIINAYCTSSYVAIHKAIQSIANGECKQAIVGGVNLVSPEEMSKAVASDFGGLFSKNGDTRSFSEDAEGFVRSEGAGVVIIKPLEQSEKDKNRILGLIKGSSVYHGGKGFSIEAPNARGIKKAIEDSILKSKVSIDTIDYVEAHGIANRMADAIELGAIDAVYRKYSKNPNKKWHVGTSKPVVGHSELASGMASLIKVLKAFEHKTMPGIAGLDKVNSELDPNHSLVLTKESCHWQNGTHPRRAGLNSYAVGGVNAHLILEEYPNKEMDEDPIKHKENEEIEEDKEIVVIDNAIEARQETIRETIEGISNEIFQIAKEDFDETLSPIDYDFDSIKVIEFVNRINEHFKVDVKMGQILGVDDFKSMYDAFETIVGKTLSTKDDDEVVVKDNLPMVYPLSEGQKGLWFLQNANPESTTYNVPVVFKTKGLTRVEDIYKAVRTLIKKNPVLNVKYGVDEVTGALYQEMQTSMEHLKMEEIELAEGESAENMIKNLQVEPFDLSKEVLRVHMIKDNVKQQGHVLVLMHHIVFDGSSLAPFIKEFKLILGEQSNQIERTNEVEDRSYFDYIVEETQYLESKTSDEDLEFWKNKLKGSIEKLELPYDTIKKEGNDILKKDDLVSFKVEGDSLKQLKQVAKSMKVNLSLLTLAVFKVLLYRLTNSDDIMVKMPTAGRYAEKHKNSIGYYINMMLNATGVDGTGSFSDLVQAIRAEFMESIDHLQYPYPKLLATLEATKGSGEALFPVLFIYQNIFSDLFKNRLESDITFDDGHRQELVDEYALEVLDLKDELTIQLRYKTALFSNETVTRHLGYYQKIVDAIITNPQEKIDDIQILTRQDKQELLVDFNEMNINYPNEICIHELFSEQAKATPNLTAVSYEGESITYKELAERSQQLAMFLQSRGVTPNTFLGICMDRSLEMIVAILGILKAGGTYVPIDPEYPTDRITYMIEDSIVNGNDDTKIVITQNHIEDAIATFTKEHGVDLVSISPSWEDNTKILDVKNELQHTVTASDIAYVIYTSGSTGKPKGVMVKHANVVSLLKNKETHFDFNENDVWTMFHSYCFDFSVWEMYGALLFGGELVVVSKEVAKNPDAFATLLHDKGVTVLNQTPGAFYLLQEAYVAVYKETKIRYVVFGGEALSPARLRPWYTAYLDSQLINMYGITETTVHVTYKRIAEAEISSGASNIGKALPTLGCYILDTAQQVAPMGVIGELYVGGAGVTKGYLNREALTKERFIPDPFSDDEDAILYRTGDLAKWLPDGNMEYLGRIDHQVKIRGFRIELGEIEQRLLSKDSIEEAVVLARDVENGEKELVAYVIFGGEANTTTELREYLSEILPTYMVPGHYVKLDFMPLTRNGKIDRKLLLAKSGSELSSGLAYVAPESEIEKELAEIWESHLTIDRVGMNEDYFQLGGDSIKMIRLLSEINKRFDTECPIDVFYENPTIGGISQFILKKEDKVTNVRLLKAEIEKDLENLQQMVLAQHPLAQNIANVFPMSSIQMGMIFTGQLLRENGEFGIYHDQIIIQKDMMDVGILTQAMKLMVEKHETLRTSCDLNNYDVPVQIIHKTVPIAIDFEDIRKETEENKEQYIQQFLVDERMHNPFDVDEAPVWRIRLFQISETDCVFVFQIHHAFIDGWGEKNFRVELFEIYEALQNDETYHPHALKCSMSDSVISDMMELKNETNQIYWKERISGYKRLNVFEDRLEDNEVTKLLDGNLCAAVLQKCKADNITPKGLFFSGYLYVLSLLTSEKDVTTGLVAHRRPMVEDGDSLLGCFLNSVPFRYDMTFAEGQSWTEYAKNIEEEFQELRGKDRFPLSEIAVIANESSANNPFFDILFNYVDFHVLEKSFDEGEFSSIQSDHQGKSFSIQNYDRTNTHLNFSINSTGNEISVLLKQKRSLKSNHKLTDLITYFENFLSSYAYDGDNLVKSINVIPKQELEDIIYNFNATDVMHPDVGCTHELFDKQAQLTPNAIAVTFGDKEVTYETLARRSEQLAIYLQGCGVKTDTLVGICMERSIEMVVAMLAVLKSGGAYVPIDSEYPQDRIAFMLEDAIVEGNQANNINLVLTQEHLKSDLDVIIDDLDITVVPIASNWESNETIMEAKGTLEFNKANLNDLAYVIYTSGSTGKPKGVLIEHRSFIDLIQYQKTFFEINEEDQFLQFSNFSFDASVEQIYLPLISGGTLNIIPKSDLLDMDRFKEVVLEKRITHLHAVPSFLGELPFVSNTKLKRIISGGDVFDQRVLNVWGGKGIRIIDKYGPSEATVSAVQRDLELPLTGKHIGKPLGNTYCYVLDTYGNVQPMGTPGELCIGGGGLARGYLNRPELTKKKFIENPFGTGRIYRTGDLARWISGGNIEFLGRMDHQVKINGFRVELGEIEFVINSHPEIINNVVLAKEQAGSRQLVAYCVLKDKKGAFAITDLRSYLLERMPEYLVPKFIFEIDEIPLTPNQKADRKALLSRDLEISGVEEYVAPKTEVEKKLAKIWQDVLNVEKVGVNDNFFELGGHSLLITKLLSRVSKSLGVSLELSKVFERPNLKQLAEVLEISTQKEISSIEVLKDRTRLPLSFAQQRLWFLSELGQSDSYHISGFLEIKGDLNVEALEKSLNDLIARHEILRTTFRKDESGYAYQHIEDQGTIVFFKEDYGSSASKTLEMEERSEAFAKEPFNLNAGPLLRALLIRSGENEYRFGLCMHHIISDGWSINIMIKELNAIYSAYVNEEEVKLEHLPIQYADYTIWQRKLFEERQFAEALEHWEQHLKEYVDLELPTDFSRPKIATGKGKQIVLELGDAIKEKLNAFSMASNGTLFTSLLTSVYVLLYKYSGQDDICIGVPVANRTHDELEGVIGFFVNTVVNRLKLEDEDSLLDVFNKVQKELVRSQKYQDVPFDKIVEVVQPSRETGKTPIFQTMVNYVQAEAEIRFGGTTVEPVESMESNTAKFDLTFSFSEDANGRIRLFLEYNTDVYKEATVMKLAEGLQLVFETLTSEFEKTLDACSLLTSEDLRLLKEFNDTTVDYPKDKSISEVFSLQAKATPKAVALVFGKQAITYETLEKRSHQLALYLQKEGVEPETLVGICMERSIEMMVAILGVLKSGGAYVPIDPAYPKERISYMIEDSIVNGNEEEDVKLMLVQEHLKVQMKDVANKNVTMITMSSNWEDNEKITCMEGSLDVKIASNNLAYIIYTSGSTGKPKGVMVENRSVLRLVKNASYYNFDNEDVILSTGAFSFDATIFEFFGPLLNGGKLVFALQDTLLNNHLLSEVIVANKVNVMWFTSSWLNQLVDTDISIFNNIDTVLSGGERLSPAHIGKLRETYPSLQIINGYGPTENTTFSTTYDIEEVNGDIPIGKPISNDQVYIFDRNMALQPIGVSGELCVSGDGLARGYLNRPDLTAEKFVKNPFGQGKLYKTGDLARWTVDGNIDYLGRIDEQIKLRGFRIEMGEIETTLNGQDAIRNSAVIVKEHLGVKQLVAYCVLDNGFEALDVSVIKSNMSISLPEYMIPSFIIEIDALPLTSNGKADKKALLKKDIELDAQRESIAPRTHTEKALSVIWKDILKVESIGIHESFFELGGHSLLVTKLLSRIHKHFGVTLLLSKVFETPSLEQIAKAIENGTTQALPDMEVVVERKRLPLSFAQQRLWFLAELGQGNRYHIPSMMQIRGKLNVEVLERSINHLVQRHEILRTTFRKDDKGLAYQHIEATTRIDVAKEDYSQIEEIERSAKLKTRGLSFVNEPFDLSKGPLLRSIVMKTSDEDCVFGLCMHHIISDAWSMNIIIDELNAIYTAYINDEEVKLAALPIQYADYAVWQRNLFEGEQFLEGLSYWKQHLEGYVDLQMPMDHNRPKIATGQGRQIVLELDDEVKSKLNSFGIASGGTLFTSLLTSVYILLHKYSGQDDICIGLPLANRAHNEVEGLIGFFVNTLVSRLKFDKEDTLVEIFGKVQRELMKSQEHQEIPFNKIVEAVQPERQTDKTPIFQVMVNYVQLEANFSLGETTISPIELFEPDTAKFDLSFSFFESPNNKMNLSLGYNTDIYSNTTAQKLLEGLVRVIKMLPEESEVTLGGFNIMSDTEREELLFTLNATDDAYDESSLIHTLFQEQAKKTPDAIAVVCGDEEMSYEALDLQSNQLAHYLNENFTIDVETLIGVRLERNEKLIVTLLAILKTGAAYVPLDVNYPEERIAYIEKDSDCELVIDDAVYSNYLKQRDDYAIAALESNCQAKDNAYVIYTSGTTGKPKGVMITHQNACALIHWARKEYDADHFEITYAATSHCFDLSVYEMFYTLSIGKAIRVLNSALEIREYVSKDEDILINTVPSIIRTIMDEDVDLGNVNVINLAGEPFPADIAKRLQESNAEVRNLYGPSEDTTYSTCYKLNKDNSYSSVPIGRPILNTKAYILDKNHELMPRGGVGQLYLSGDGVAKGYLNKPELTNERFVANPFETDKVMYDTGDLAKWLPNGTIEYLGRKDNQVKIRGYRIELGEIENAFAELQDVKEVVVVAKEHLGSKQLIAYCVMDDGDKLDIQEIKNQLEKSLPDYMIPNFIIPLDQIPLTPNGKIDRKDLMSRDLELTSTSKYVSATTEIERQLVEIWKEVLNLKDVGIHDNFFELGGHSLLTIQLIQRIDENMGNHNVQLMELMNTPTIYQQALLMEKSEGKIKTKHLVTFNESKTLDPDKVETYIIPGMPGMVDGYYELAEAFIEEGKNAVYGIQMLGLGEGEKPLTSIEEMAAHNIEVIKKLSPKKIRLVAHSYGGLVLYEMIRQLSKESMEVVDVILLDSHLPNHSLKIIDKTQGLVMAVMSMLKIKGTRKEISEFSKKAIKRSKKTRADSIYDFLIGKGAKIDRTFFHGIFDIYNNSMNVSYQPKERLDVDVVLVIAKQTRASMSRTQDWSPYFNAVQAIESSGNHFELVKKPFVSKWKGEIANLKQK